MRERKKGKSIVYYVTAVRPTLLSVLYLIMLTHFTLNSLFINTFYFFNQNYWYNHN